MSMHHGWRKFMVVAFIFACGLLLAGVAVPWLYRAQQRAHWQDLNQVRGMGNGFTLYFKKYGAFPHLAGRLTPAEAVQAQQNPAAEFARQRANGGKPACLALERLMAGGFIEDPMAFFSPRDSRPTDRTLNLMASNWDRLIGPFACTYAYDPGHLPQHGNTVLFGNREGMLRDQDMDTAIVLTCAMQAKEVAWDSDEQFVIQTPRADTGAPAADNIYKDDSPTLGPHDSFLVWDVPAELR